MRDEAAPPLERRLRVVRDRGLETLDLERLGQQLGDVDVVVDDEHAHVGAGRHRLRGLVSSARFRRGHDGQLDA